MLEAKENFDKQKLIIENEFLKFKEINENEKKLLILSNEELKKKNIEEYENISEEVNIREEKVKKSDLAGGKAIIIKNLEEKLEEFKKINEKLESKLHE